MFLRYLSDHDYEPEFWSFVLRMETLVGGFVQEASRHIDHLSPEQARNYFENCFAFCFESEPPGEVAKWWGEHIPGIDWFWDYFEREYPYMVRESLRRAAESQTGNEPDSLANQKTISSCSCGKPGHVHSEWKGDVNMSKIRQYAREYEPFRRFLIGTDFDLSTDHDDPVE